VTRRLVATARILCRGFVARKPPRHTVHAVAAQALSCVLTVFAAVVCFPALGQGAAAVSSVTVQGKLENAGDAVPVLKTAGKDYSLAARTDWLLHTLQDKRLAGREIRVQGELLPDGKIKVNHFYTFKNGQMYRIRYFCHVCNIEALGPGNCVCCQQPTELQEIPVAQK
jgi:hypothetical protein